MNIYIEPALLSIGVLLSFQIDDFGQVKSLVKVQKIKIGKFDVLNLNFRYIKDSIDFLNASNI